MTVFRYFPTKAALVVDDPFDPELADAVRMQPRELGPVDRVLRGIEGALAGVDPEVDELTRRRVALIAHTPALEYAMASSTARTRDAIRDALVADGAEVVDASVAAAAVIAGMSAALLENARVPPVRKDHPTIVDAVRRAIQVLGGSP